MASAIVTETFRSGYASAMPATTPRAISLRSTVWRSMSPRVERESFRRSSMSRPMVWLPLRTRSR